MIHLKSEGFNTPQINIFEQCVTLDNITYARPRANEFLI
jgi:hypothetical protein